MITPLTAECGRRGKGLDPECLQEIRLWIHTPMIEEVDIETGYSYFPKGLRKNARFVKIAPGNHGRIFLEFNYVEFSKDAPYLWKLSEEERQRYRASGVAYCYTGDDLDMAKELIEEAKQLHDVLGKQEQLGKRKKTIFSYEKDPSVKHQVEIWTYKVGPNRPFQYRLAIKAFGKIIDQFPLFDAMEGIQGAREFAKSFILSELYEAADEREREYIDSQEEIRVMSCDDYRTGSGSRCQAGRVRMGKDSK